MIAESSVDGPAPEDSLTEVSPSLPPSGRAALPAPALQASGSVDQPLAELTPAPWMAGGAPEPPAPGPWGAPPPHATAARQPPALPFPA